LLPLCYCACDFVFVCTYRSFRLTVLVLLQRVLLKSNLRFLKLANILRMYPTGQVAMF
jgi:hypothetical protein